MDVWELLKKIPEDKREGILANLIDEAFDCDDETGVIDFKSRTGAKLTDAVRHQISQYIPKEPKP